MPCDYRLYPKDWKQRRLRILHRAGQRLDHAGRVVAEAACEYCDAPNHEFILRDRANRLKWRYPNGNDQGETDPDYRATAIVLTIAHLDRTGPPGPADGAPTSAWPRCASRATCTSTGCATRPRPPPPGYRSCPRCRSSPDTPATPKPTWPRPPPVTAVTNP